MKQVTDTGAIEKAVDEIIAPIPTRLKKPGEAVAGRLVRRAGDEGDRRKANPQAVQPS